MFNQYTYKSMGTINRHMQVLGEKVADINNIFTTGYRGMRTSFHETMDGIRSYMRRDFNNGIKVKTNRELDFAIQGKGFFEVEMPDGTTAFTRNGSFTLGPNGRLLSAQGYPLVTSNPNTEFLASNYDVMADGTIKSFDAGALSATIVVPIGTAVQLESDGTLRSEEGEMIGKLGVVTFTNNDALHDIGDNLFIATDAAGELHDVEVGEMLGQTQIKQGYIEQSNVSIVGKMADMVQLNTAIKAEMKIIKVLDQMQENLNSTITRNI